MRFLRTCMPALGYIAVVTAAAGTAFAQASPSPYPPPCDPSRVSKNDIDRAHSVFLSGKQFLEESNYDKAIGYFDDAYSIDCSVHAILPIIATAYERKGDKSEAIRALEEYVKRAPTAPDHDVIERRIKNLKEQLGHESRTPAASASVVPAPSASASAPPPEGAASAPAPMNDAGISVAPATLSAPIASPPETETPRHGAGPWVLVGVGGVIVVSGIVIYAVGANDVSKALDKCPMRVCPRSATSTIAQGNDGNNLEKLGGVFIGVGAAAAAAGVVWHFLEKPAQTSAPSSSPTVAPVVGRDYTGVSVSGSF